MTRDAPRPRQPHGRAKARLRHPSVVCPTKLPGGPAGCHGWPARSVSPAEVEFDPVWWTPDSGVRPGEGVRMGRPSKYPEEFRCEAVALALALSSDDSPASVAHRLGVNETTLRNWVAVHLAEAARACRLVPPVVRPAAARSGRFRQVCRWDRAWLAAHRSAGAVGARGSRPSGGHPSGADCRSPEPSRRWPTRAARWPPQAPALCAAIGSGPGCKIARRYDPGWVRPPWLVADRV